MTAIIMRMAKALPVWLWLALAAAGAVAGAVSIGLSQAGTIGDLESSLQESRQATADAEHRARQQARRYNRQIDAMGKAVAAQKGYAREAENRARGLQKRIQRARGDSDALDACLGMPLPDGMADSLRQ